MVNPEIIYVPYFSYNKKNFQKSEDNEEFAEEQSD